MGFRRRDGLPSRGGGNYTRGTARRGNKNGRRPLHPPGTALTSVFIKITDPEYAVLSVLGGNKRVPGMRRAIGICARLLPLWAQDIDQVRDRLNHTFNGKAQMEQTVRETCERLEAFLRATWDNAEPMPAPVSGDYEDHREAQLLGEADETDQFQD